MPISDKPHTSEKVRLLVVEDEPVVAEHVQMMLEDLEYGVVAAVPTGEEAIDKTAELGPDLVIMDVGLAGRMDGVEAAIRIQSDFEIPVVYLSALADDYLLERAKANAPYGYLLKPFKARELHVTIQMALQRKRQEVVTRLHAESLLRKEKAFSDATIESLPGNFYVLDENLRPVKWNRNLEHSSGYSAQEISEMKAADFFTEEDRTRLSGKLQEAFRTHHLDVEARLSTKDGRAVPYHYQGMRMDLDGEKHLVGLGIDITERERAEQAKAELESMLRRAQKMEAIGTLAGGIAHDFNNILAAIIGYTELACHDAGRNPVVLESLEKVLEAGMRAKELTKQILLFSRQADPERKPLRADLIVKEAMNLMRATLPATIEIRSKIDTERAVVLADPTEIHQIVVNLCTNAKDAMEAGGGVLDILLTEESLDDRRVRDIPDLAPGPYVKLAVKDTGNGMDRAVMDRIFDPFFTTKGPGRGTGMGLSVVHGIVEKLGGTITVASTPGQGTVFEVLIPKLEKDVPAEKHRRERIPTGKGNILLVDDESAVVDSYRRIITNLGYNVVALTDSREALAVFRRQPSAFDLVITDMTMPILTGVDLAREVLRVRPETPVILCTGFNEALTSARTKQIGIANLLIKPIPTTELANAIHQALHSKQDRKRNPDVKIAAGM